MSLPETKVMRQEFKHKTKVMRQEFKHKIREAIEVELNAGFYSTFFGEIEVMLSDTLDEIEAEFKNKKKYEAIDREFKKKLSGAIYGEFSKGFGAGEYVHIEKRLVEKLHNIVNEWVMEKVKSSFA